MKQYSVLSVEGNVASDTGAVLLSAITSNVANNATGFFSVPSGTTAQRPASPVNGMLRYNTTTLRFEFYANGGWRNMARLDGDTFTGAVVVNGNLTVDTDVLFVDATNNRVGIGTISPSTKLQVVGNTSISGQFSQNLVFNSGWKTMVNGGGMVWTAPGISDSNYYLGFANYVTAGGAATVYNSIVVNTANGNVGIGTTVPVTEKLEVNGNIKASQFRISALNTAPASATATGTLGEIRYDTNYMYVCVATNTWKRSPLTTW